MKKVNKLNVRINFSRRSLKCTFGYGAAKPYNSRTWYVENMPNKENEAVEELKEMLSMFLEAHCAELFKKGDTVSK